MTAQGAVTLAKEETLHVRMNSEMKERIEALYQRFGTTFAEGVRMFATQSLLIDGIPLAMSTYQRTKSSYRILSGYENQALIEREPEAFYSAMEAKHDKAP